MVAGLRFRRGLVGAAMGLLGGACWLVGLGQGVLAAEVAIHADRPNVVSFAPQNARFVRCVILKTSGAEGCIDELEVFGPEGKQNLALANLGAKATASSCLAGYAQHAVEHLNDGLYGNAHSWIPATAGEEWAQIELPKPTPIVKVVFSRDRQREYADRVPLELEVRLSDDGKQWRTVQRISGPAAPVALRRVFGSFAAALPDPPPPPQIAADGAVAVAAAQVDLRVAAKNARGFLNLALVKEAKAAASSLLPGHAIHQIAHLNDGLAGNDHSWISNGEPSWAEIDLGGVYWVYSVAFGSDSSRRFGDRAATDFRILAATQYAADSASPAWSVAHRRADGSPVHLREEFVFKPVQARWLRVAVDAASGGNVRIDELEVYGQKDPIPLDRIGPLPDAASSVVRASADVEQGLRYAFLGEEHARLKTYGRADLNPALVPYNGRVKEYPRHVGDDLLPLPPLAAAPILDGKPDDACWSGASRGAVRVASPNDPRQSPLVTSSVTAGWNGEHLYLAIQPDRLLSSHLAVVSSTNGDGAGVVAITPQGMTFNAYESDGSHGIKLKQSRPLEGVWDKPSGVFELRVPLAWFPECRKQGLRVGLGMGGKHTAREGRPVTFVFSPVSVAQIGPCVDRTFRVRLAVATGAKSVTLSGNAGDLKAGLTLNPGQEKELVVAAERGPIGPQYNLQIEEEGGEKYSLHMFRYDPLEPVLMLTEAMLDRFAAKGLDVKEERAVAAAFCKRQAALLSTSKTSEVSKTSSEVCGCPSRSSDDQLAAERQAAFEARLAKRRLFFRDPDLEPVQKILFVKRHAYEPSHNYSVMLDSPWRPGGGVYRLDIPRRDGRFLPDEATLARLFDSGAGIARDPVASFDLSTIWFGYRPSYDGYFHIMRMKPDGSGLRQVTSGPFHDYWPCPLPDGGMAFISSRCKARYLCWRPQVSVLFRMDLDGENMQPLSYANLSEWGPSVTSDGRIIWTRSEYIDKGADFSHTLWTVRPDGTQPELVFGNTIVQPNGYANGREVPGSSEICCTLISHFGDLNGPIALVDLSKGRFNPKAITSITPEVPWPGAPPHQEYFRDPLPIARDYVLCSHAPYDRAGIYVIDRFGNREVLHMDATFGSMCPIPYRVAKPSPVLAPAVRAESEEETPMGELVLADVYRGIEANVPRGKVKYLRIVEEVRAGLQQLANGEYRKDHDPFMHFYAAPVDLVSGPYGWPSYVAKASWGLVPVEEDGSAHFYAPAGKTLYFQALDQDLNEVQRMRSVVQLQPGEKRSCIGCHEDRRTAPPSRTPIASRRAPHTPEAPPWGTEAFSFEQAVQPVLDRKCVQCHHAGDKDKIDLAGTLDANRVPASYRTLVQQGWVHVLDCGYNSGGNEKRDPLTFGTVKSKLWKVLDKPGGHYDAKLTRDEMHAIKCWTDMNCPLWPDYQERTKRPMMVKAP